MKRCLILMSTYNGSKYLKEQLDSLLNQKDVDVTIQIRDDKSNDDTLKILEDYSSKYKNVRFKVNEKNKGFTYNFIDNLFEEESKGYDYYAFSDQDDVWKEDKLIQAINKIEQIDSKLGCLYCSNLTLVDNNLNVIGYQEKKDISKKYYSGLASNIATGCTMVFDKTLYEKIIKIYPKDIYLHDYYIFLIARYTASVYYDTNSYILYRQHNSNMIGSNKKLLSKNRFKNYINPEHKTSSLVKTFYFNYKDDIKQKDKKYVEIAALYNVKFKYKLKLFFSYKIRKRRLNFMFKLQILFGKY